MLLEITDTASEMDPATQAHIFEPFFTTKEVGKGTGLGLSTVYGVIKQSSGCIAVESALGHGTAFSIYLPQTSEKAPARKPRPCRAENLRGTETVLLVEDAGSVRELTREWLKNGRLRRLGSERSGRCDSDRETVPRGNSPFDN